ncbi:MAG: hypothetical protein CMB82_09945 [Flammeovirgaceae bacterium]|nr:hypothetical protein [Flammeovirgaceae bacterium]
MTKRLIFSLTLSMVGFFLLADPIQRNLQPFKQLYVKEGIEVLLIKGTEYNAKVDVSGCDPEDVLTEVNNGRLTIRMRSGRYRNIEVKVALTYVNLGEIDVSSSGVVKGSDQLESEVLEIEVSSAGSLELNILSNSLDLDVSSSGFIALNLEVNKLEIEIASAGKVELTGQVRDQVLDISSAGHYEGFTMISERTLVDISSGGLAQVYAKEKLDVYASSGGSVEFQGSPVSLSKRLRSGGSVSQY